MKHLKTFETFQVNEEIFGLGKKTTEQKLAKAPKEFLDKLAEYEEKAKADSKKFSFNKESIINQAYDNGFRGRITHIGAGGKYNVIYKDGLSGIEKVASGSSGMTVGK